LLVTVPWAPWVTESTASTESMSESLARISTTLAVSSRVLSLSLTRVGGSSTGLTVTSTVAVTPSIV